MHTSSFGVTDEEYLFIQYMAKLSVSELVRTSLLTDLEKQIDITLYEKAMANINLKMKAYLTKRCWKSWAFRL